MSAYHHVFASLIEYRYALLFPLAVLEGPTVTVVSGILVAHGKLGFFPSLATVLAGDLVSDPSLYLLGRFGRGWLKKFPVIKVPEARLKQIERQYAHHPWKTMIAGKLSYGVGSLFVIATGASRMPWRKFARYIAVVDSVKSSLLLSLGYFSGRTILRLSGYLRWYALAVVCVAAAGVWLKLRRRPKNV